MEAAAGDIQEAPRSLNRATTVSDRLDDGVYNGMLDGCA
jgi:hypothetical protein